MTATLSVAGFQASETWVSPGVAARPPGTLGAVVSGVPCDVVPCGVAQDWLEATKLAVREARRRVAAPLPLHVVGYSNGGALALKYSLDALEDPSLPRAERLVLLSPMLRVAGYARFAGLAGLPAVFPAFAKAAWLDLLPEYNPFKYNSFPVNGAR